MKILPYRPYSCRIKKCACTDPHLDPMTTTTQLAPRNLSNANCLRTETISAGSAVFPWHIFALASWRARPSKRKRISRDRYKIPVLSAIWGGQSTCMYPASRMCTTNDWPDTNSGVPDAPESKNERALTTSNKISSMNCCGSKTAHAFPQDVLVHRHHEPVPRTIKKKQSPLRRRPELRCYTTTIVPKLSRHNDRVKPDTNSIIHPLQFQ